MSSVVSLYVGLSAPWQPCVAELEPPVLHSPLLVPDFKYFWFQFKVNIPSSTTVSSPLRNPFLYFSCLPITILLICIPKLPAPLSSGLPHLTDFLQVTHLLFYFYTRLGAQIWTPPTFLLSTYQSYNNISSPHHQRGSTFIFLCSVVTLCSDLSPPHCFPDTFLWLFPFFFLCINHLFLFILCFPSAPTPATSHWPFFSKESSTLSASQNVAQPLSMLSFFHHLLKLLVRKRAGRVDREEKKKENKTLGRPISWSWRLNGLQKKRRASHRSVHGVGDGSRRPPPWVCPWKPDKFPSSPTLWARRIRTGKSHCSIPTRWTLNRAS